MHNALHINADGQSEFLFMKDKLKNLIREMQKYCYRKLPSGVVTDEPIKQADHGLDACAIVHCQVHMEEAGQDPASQGLHDFGIGSQEGTGPPKENRPESFRDFDFGWVNIR